tara:strand:+ start:406 stop:852 length:447 start_codon:yes stop_codon:yes gene_type:complete
MKIILKQSIDNLGNQGEIVDVKPGYARNYLIPKGWAKQATKLNIISTQKEIEVKLQKEAKNRQNLEALGKQLDKLSLKFELKAGEEGKLFGSVTSQMIVDAISEKGYSINKKEIEIPESINHVGKYFVDVKLGHGFSGRVKLKVIAEK